MRAPAKDDEIPPRPACPICGKPTIFAYRPFCSKRCADVDLQRWLSGRYAIPVSDEIEEPGDDPGEDDGARGGSGGNG